MKAKLTIAIITFFMITSSVIAQTGGGPPKGMQKGKPNEIGYGKISGTVIDESETAVPYATVSIVKEGSDQIIDGAVADDKGEFVIRSIVEGTYMVNISFIGYETVKKGPYEFTGKGNSYDLGKINISSTSVSLDEVVVQGERDLIEDKVDRIVYNAEQDKTTAGGDATDVLRRVPLLSVDLDGNVSLRGSSNIRVLIDGRPSTITAGSIADALKQIPADQIKSVEVITSPSARYDAEGTGGIINIITKKNDLQGGSLSINSSAGLRGSNLGLNANYRKGRYGMTLGGFGRSGYNILGEFENVQTTRNLNGEVVSRTLQNAETENNLLFGRYNFGADYAINKYNWIGGAVNFGLFNFKSSQDDRLTEVVTDEAERRRVENVGIDNLSNSVDVSLNYIKTFEEKGKEVSLITLYSQNTRTNDFTISPVEGGGSDILNENKSYNREYTAQLDYIEPMGEKVIFETGVKNIYRDVTSEFQFNINGVPVSNANQSNNLDYVQNVMAGYVSSTVEFAKGLTSQLGGRYEYTNIDAQFADNQELEIADYGTFVPSINLAKKVGQMNTVKFAYNRRIQRPSLRFLNPNIDASNPLNISQGNPELEPEFTNNFEISYSTFKKGTSLNVSAFARNTTGSIQPVRETIGQDTVFTTFLNIGEENAYGISLFANIRAGKLTLNGSVDTYYAVLDNNIEDPIFNASNEGIVVSGRLFGSYKLSDRWAFQLFSFARGRRVELQGSSAGFYIYSLSLNREFANKRGSIGFGAENFLQSGMRQVSEIESPLITQENINVMRNMNFKINFSYRIGKLTTGQQRRRMRKVNNDDLKEGNSDGMSQN